MFTAFISSVVSFSIAFIYEMGLHLTIDGVSDLNGNMFFPGGAYNDVPYNQWLIDWLKYSLLE